MKLGIPVGGSEWFAWRPVQLITGQWAWLETVMRYKQATTNYEYIVRYKAMDTEQ